VKKTFAMGIILLSGVFVLVQWNSRSEAVSGQMYAVKASSSQIFIHGTPVCVFTLGENIVAEVGPCPQGSGDGSEAAPGEHPDTVQPGNELPPGHPPLDQGLLPDDQQRRVLI
jgi:hypothetical protein